MKKAFTLVEMLIVVAILAVLMSIVFRLGGISDSDSRRTSTVVKMQKIENCLSGYYAAFGSYPPVKVHGSRDINCAVDENGDQDQTKGGASGLNWRQVNAACRSQPFGCEYPGGKEDNDVISQWSDELKERAGNATEYPEYAKSGYASIFLQGFNGLEDLKGFPNVKDETDWKRVKLFKFGMMSFLLPRYLFMMDFAIDYNRPAIFEYAQWTDNNDVPCDPFEGCRFGQTRDNDDNSGDTGFGDGDVDDEKAWGSIMDNVKEGRNGNSRNLVKIANIPSQAVCARWMPNLEHTAHALRQMTFFGIDICSSYGLPLDDEYPPDPGVHFRPTSAGGGNGTPYKNATITIYDGWSNEFYYYSPAPYQTYTVWSAGPNRKTFPPWVSIDKLGSNKEEAMDWKNDDIVQMSH